MTESSVKIVQEQIPLVKEKVGAEAAGVALYTRMFNKDDALVDAMFHKISKEGRPYDGTNKELKRQSTTVVKSLFDIVLNFYDPSVENKLKRLAESHKSRNIEKKHFDFVKGCLLEVLHESLGDKIDQNAWAEVFDFAADNILKQCK